MNNDNEKKLDFWDFERIMDPNATPKKRAFPVDREVSQKEMHFYLDKLNERIQKYKDNSCYHFLEGYYLLTKRVYEEKNEDIMVENYKKAQDMLKLFTYCWETNKKENINLI